MRAAWPSLALLFFTACSASHGPDGPGEARDALCVTHWLAFGYGQSVLVYEATPDGPARPIEVPVTEGPGDDRMSAVTHLDVDRDGVRDVVVRNTYGGAALVDEPISLTVIRGASLPFGARERLRFTSDAQVTGGGVIRALGDWDGDGREDLLAAWEGVVLLSGETVRETDQTCPSGAGVGDVDADGVADSACVGAEGELVVVHGGAGGPRLRTLSLRAHVEQVERAGDLDGDGHADVMVLYVGGESEILSGAALGAELVASGSGVWSWAPLGDVDADGFDDLAAIRDGSVHFLRGTEEGVRDAGAAIVGGSAIRAAGDTDCDGFADALVSDGETVALHRGGPGGISPRASFRVPSERRTFLPVFD